MAGEQVQGNDAQPLGAMAALGLAQSSAGRRERRSTDSTSSTSSLRPSLSRRNSSGRSEAPPLAFSRYSHDDLVLVASETLQGGAGGVLLFDGCSKVGAEEHDATYIS